MKEIRVCLLCGKEITDHKFIANNNRKGWTFAHNHCRDAILKAQQNAVYYAVIEIGARIPRIKYLK